MSPAHKRSTNKGQGRIRTPSSVTRGSFSQQTRINSRTSGWSLRNCSRWRASWERTRSLPLTSMAVSPCRPSPLPGESRKRPEGSGSTPRRGSPPSDTDPRKPPVVRQPHRRQGNAGARVRGTACARGTHASGAVPARSGSVRPSAASQSDGPRDTFVSEALFSRIGEAPKEAGRFGKPNDSRKILNANDDMHVNLARKAKFAKTACRAGLFHLDA